MSLLKKLFGKNSSIRKTGVYKVENQTLIELDELPGNGSINAVTEELGYSTNQIHTVLTFDSNIISNIGVKIFTKEPVFVFTEDGVTDLKMSTVNTELKNIDWGSEYSSTEIEYILEKGIEEKNLNFNFLNSVTKLISKTDKIFLAQDLNLYLHFEDGLLIRFNSTDGLTAQSKWLKDLNLQMFNNMLKEAEKFQSSKMEAIEEVNKQCEALQLIPQAINNEHLGKHLNQYGNYNFYNLRAAHYLPELKIDEFLLVNKGRFVKISENEIKVENFVYQFDENGLLSKTWIE